MSKQRLLDLFCGAGGSAVGYYRAGFEVVGIDIAPMPHYPFEFHRADALEYCAAHGAEFDAIHASPPCQAYTKSTKQWRAAGRDYPDLISQTRDALTKFCKPYIIENVPGAPLRNPVLLNGHLFGLFVHRPRLFECNFDIPLVLLPQGEKPIKMGRAVSSGDVIQPVGHFSGADYARSQMGIDWMTVSELAQAIPPAYTEFIGSHLMSLIKDTTNALRKA